MSKSPRILCTAGISHFVMAPNGDVFRCHKDPAEGRPPMFNARGGWKPLKSPSLCPHDACLPCDRNFVTRWSIGRAGEASDESRIPGIVGEGCPALMIELMNQEIENPSLHIANIVWQTTHRCNYDCLYCSCSIVGKEFADRGSPPDLPLAEWHGIWNDILLTYETGLVTVTGGEPLLTPVALPIMEKIADSFAMGIISNLSLKVINKLQSLVSGPLKPGSGAGIVQVVASCHPLARGYSKEAFLAALLFLKNHGHNVLVNFVGHPVQIHLAESYSKLFAGHNIPFRVTHCFGFEVERYGQERVATTPLAYGYIEKNILRNLDAIVDLENDVSETSPGGEVEGDLFDHSFDLKKESFRVKRNRNLLLEGTITNSGTAVWRNKKGSPTDGFKIAGAMFLPGNNETALRHYQGFIPYADISPGETFDFHLYVDTLGLDPGRYVLKIDILKGKEFGFCSRGAEPATVAVDIE